MFVKDLMCQAAFLSGRNTWWLSGYKSQWSCFRTVFSQTQNIKNVCLKRRFQFVGRKKLQIENPFPSSGKELACFSASFRSRPALFHFAKTRPAFAPLRFKKANTFLCAPPHFIPYCREG